MVTTAIPFEVKQWWFKCSLYTFWFDAHCSSWGIKGTVVGWLFSPLTASLWGRAFFFLFSFCPSHTWAHTLCLNSLVCVCVFARRMGCSVSVCAYKSAVICIGVHDLLGPPHSGSTFPSLKHSYTHAHRSLGGLFVAQWGDNVASK